MNSITEYFNQSELALAAYANLIPGVDPVPALQDASVGMSATQAATFAATYTVIDQYTDPASGFSATVFERSGQRYMAIRGTQPGDVLDLIADADLALSGAAAKQTISLFNYVQRLSGVKGQPVAQLEWNGQDYVLNQTGAVGLLDTPLSGALPVTGHSLGGHLAMALGRLFPQGASQIYTYNAPGFINAAADSFFARVDAALGRTSSTFADAVTTNLYGSGLNIIAGYANDHGTPKEIFLESSAHSIVDITDSLAVYNLLATLDPTLNTGTTGINAITGILKASSNIAANSLESAVSALGKLFLVNGAAGYNANEFDGNRDLLYSALNDINTAIGTNTYTLRDLTGFNAAQLASVAQSNLAYRYALVNGDPFALVGDDTIYATHNNNGELDLFDTATGLGALTTQYLTDRSDYLTKLLARNVQDDTDYRLSSGGGDMLYRDNRTSTITEIRTGSLLATDDARRHIEFGSDQGETISGGSQNDRLYGMGGDDTLNGGDGQDYIEGNAGDDTLTGGVGNDTLVGGAGLDTYHVGDGLDTILDSDGQGRIYLGADLLNGGESKDGGHIWQSSDGKHTYAFISGDPTAAEGATLVVDDKLTIKHFHAGDLGLTLNVATTAQPSSTTTYIGSSGMDWVTFSGYLNDNTLYGNNQVVGNVNGDNLIVGNGTSTSSATTITGPMGDIFILGNGNNRIYADDQVDIATALARQNTLTPTGQLGDFIAVGAVSHPPYADGGVTGGQQLYSFPVGSGNNTIVGSTGNDLIIAGGGSNTVILGPGNNTFIGGSTLILGQLNTTEPWWGLLTSSVTVSNNMPQYQISMPALTLQGSGGFTPSAQLAALQSYNQYNSDNSWCDIGRRRQVSATATHPAVIVTSWSINTSSSQPQFSPYGPYYETYPSTPAGNSRDTIFAGSGNNLIVGSNGGNYIDAGSGNSNVFSGGGDDVVFGGDGNSLINAQGGNDYIVAGDGNHRIWGGAGDNIIYGGNGDNVIFSGIGAWNWADINAGSNFVNSGTGNATIYGSGGNDTLVSGSEAGTGKTTTIHAGNGNETIFGGNGDDTIYGGAGNNTIYAGDGNTTIRLSGNANETSTVYGGNGNDTIYSGSGSDMLMGGAGDDTYVFGIGGGVDTIIDTVGKNKIVFGAGIDPASVTLGLGSLLIRTGNGNDAIHIQGFDPNDVLANPLIESVQFADGTTLGYAQLLERGFDIAGTAGDDILNGTNTTDRISGGNGNDVLNGGAGNDVLRGGRGNDTYEFYLGDGADHIEDTQGLDTIYLGDELTVADLQVSRVGNDLVLTIGDEGDSITIANWSIQTEGVKQIEFSNGDIKDIFMLMNHAPVVVNPFPDQSATEGQAFNCSLQLDIFTGGFLNDATDTGTPDQVWPRYSNYFDGSGGNDIYSFARGDGNGYVSDWDNSPMDTVQFMDVLAADVTLTQNQYGDVIMSVNGTADSLTLDSWIGYNEARIEQVTFADGAVWGMADIQSLLSASRSPGSDYITGSGDADTIFGGAGNDGLIGAGGSDLLSGGSGNDVLEADRDYSDGANDLLMGGEGYDDLLASVSNDLLIGGKGDDYITGYDGHNVILFNRGDGQDEFDPWSSNEGLQANTLSLGGGISYADLSIRDGGDDLVLDMGDGDSIFLYGWFDSSMNNKVISTLQIITEAMPDYDPNSANPLLNKRIQQFDFLALVAQFEAALATDPWLTTWQLVPHLGGFSLGSDTEAIGGDMAYLYGKNGNLNGLSEAELRAQLNDASFGTSNQVLTMISGVASLFNDVDFIHGDHLSYSATLVDGSALPSWLTFDAARGTFSGTPEIVDAGILTVAVTATDSGGLSATTNFVLTVTGNGSINVAPVAMDDMVAVSEDAAQTTIAAADLLANDIDPDAGDILSISAFDDTTAGGNAVIQDVSGNLVLDIGDRYQSLAAGQTAIDSFAYTVTDIAGATSTATINATINGVNDAPIAVSQLPDQLVMKGDAYSFQLPSGSFADVDAGDTLSYSATLADEIALPAWLTIDPATGTLSGIAGASDIGGIDIKVTATDSGGLSASGNFNLSVYNPINGTLYNDTITGTANQDYIQAGSGNDVVNADDGNDIIVGGAGSDVLAGGAGDDTFLIEGSDTAYDRFQGDAGFDTVLGGDGDDTIRVNYFTGASTVERIDGGAGVNVIAGTQYNDTINLADTELVNIAKIDGGIGNDVITGSAGNDIITGGLGSDVLAGGAGDDTFLIEGSDTAYDRFQGDAGFDTILGGDGDDTIRVNYFTGASTVERIDGGAGVNVIAGTQYNDTIDLSGTELANIANIDGGIGNDTITGSAGNDLLFGGDGSDALRDNGGNNLLDGGSGNDILTGNAGNEFLVGGIGSDTITAGDGADIIAFNKGDGQDIVNGGIGTDNTLSLGGGIQYSDLALSKTGNDLILEVGNGDQINFKNWYDTTANYKSVLDLQVVADAMAGFDRASSDPLLSKSIQDFDFTAIVDAFDQARGSSANFMHWSTTNSLLTAHLSASDSEALGGDLAYQYGRNGSYVGMNLVAAQSVINAPQFGAQTQTLNSLQGLQDGL
ncbi:MAG TPA: putative Ig domain-containing protein [Gallionella sp.]|nr:putative Ig domain-containing protein [Gallionella sp.]